MSADRGPFATRAQAQAVPAVRAAFADAHERNQPGTLAAHKRAMLHAALSGAGVELGEFDRHIADYLAGNEPHVIAVIAGWITRAGGAR